METKNKQIFESLNDTHFKSASEAENEFNILKTYTVERLVMIVSRMVLLRFTRGINVAHCPMNCQ